MLRVDRSAATKMDWQNRWFICSVCSKVVRSPALFLKHKKLECTKLNIGLASKINSRTSAPTLRGNHPENHQSDSGRKIIKRGTLYNDRRPKVQPQGDPDFRPLDCSSHSALSKERLQLQLKPPLLKHDKVKRFKCKLCDYAAYRRPALEAHFFSHTGERPFPCDKCSWRFKTLKHLRDHELTHTNVKPFKCQFCNYATRQNSNLMWHVRIHTGEKPYKCSVCDYAANRQAQLKAHFLNHTGGRPFPCDKCNLRFKTMQHLRDHEFTHSGDKPFKCTICSYATSRKARLRTHVQNHTFKSL